MVERDADKDLQIIRRELTKASWDMLQNGGHGPVPFTYKQLAHELEAGRLALMSGEIAGRQVLTMLVRTEDLIGGGRELCITAVAATDKRVIAGYIGSVLHALELESVGLGYTSTMVTTRERAIAKRVTLCGYEFVESTFRKELA